MKKWIGCGAGLLAVVLLAGGGLLQADEDLDSLKVCKDTQKLIFENAFVRIIDDRIPPGVAEPKHQHRHGVTVWINDYDAEQVVYPEGKKSTSHRVGGTAAWSEAVAHTVRNAGKTESHTIRIELKQ